MTLIDLNANSEEIMAIQRDRKPVRLFYSKTSAINKKAHMDDLYRLYEGLNFEGIPLGFITENIIKKQNNKNWNLVAVYNTPFVTKDELNALQSYLNNGGTIIIDDISLVKNEYGNELIALTKGKGTIIRLNSVAKIRNEVLSLLKEKNLLSDISIEETNTADRKGCIWRVVKNEKGNNVLSVVNVGKTEASLKISLKEDKNIICKDLIKGIAVSSTPILKPNEVYFVEVTPQN